MHNFGVLVILLFIVQYDISSSSFDSHHLFIAAVAPIPASAPIPSGVEVLVEGQPTVMFENIEGGNEQRGLKPVCFPSTRPNTVAEFDVSTANLMI